ncbi:MAG TPA: cytochrome P450 [Rhizomicrobium sp.]|nr:cytochrome P450 [Rhizomicrobium sp.]
MRSILVSDPEAIKRVLLDNAANYVKSEQFLKIIKPALGNSILTAEGAEWRFQRRTASPMFQMRHIADCAPGMAAAVNDMLSRWAALPAGAEIDVASEMMRVTYDIISRTMFSNDVALPFEKMAAAFGIYLETLGRVDLATFFLPSWVPTPNRLRGGKALAFLRKEIGGLVERRRAQLAADPSSVPDDLLTLLLKARDPEGGAVFGDAEVLDNAMTFIFAGHETTANALTWTFYLLSQFPDWDGRVADEAASALGGRDAAAADMPSLETSRMVLEESMRLYPPAPFITRRAVAADELCGVAVTPGTNVTASPWVVHRHSLLWKDPDHFDPMRFAPGARERIHRFAYIPFGGGPRICIGMAFAMQEAMIILATVARRYRLALAPDQTVEPHARVTLRPKNGLRMRLTVR